MRLRGSIHVLDRYQVSNHTHKHTCTVLTDGNAHDRIHRYCTGIIHNLHPYVYNVPYVLDIVDVVHRFTAPLHGNCETPTMPTSMPSASLDHSPCLKLALSDIVNSHCLGVAPRCPQSRFRKPTTTKQNSNIFFLYSAIASPSRIFSTASTLSLNPCFLSVRVPILMSD